MKYIINGKFLTQPVTGVQRYAREILAELDKLVGDGCDIEIAAPKDFVAIPTLKNIKIRVIGHLPGGVAWEQSCLPLYLAKRKGICVDLCNSMPIMARNITVIHDISFKANKRFYSTKARVWYEILMRFCNIEKMITVSGFSRHEIARYYGVDPNQIMVIGNGWQHYECIGFDEDIFEKYGLEKEKYYFSVSSLTPNKNFRWIAENAKKNPDVIYAVSGSVNDRVFSDVFDFEVPPNMKCLGYVSDEEAKTLMRDCKAFLFPTFYEGFGIPPLEALSVGAKIIISDASCMREIYGDTAYYIDPYDPDVDLEGLLKGSVADPSSVLDRYSWKKSAEQLYRLLCDINE